MKELLKALFEAKKEIGAISKDSENPFFKSKYFDINQLLQHVEPVLQKHGLLITQPILNNSVYTCLNHVETGKSLESVIELPNQSDPQKLGSAITYYRRYTLQSLLSLQAEDDDGNKASRSPQAKPEKKLVSLSATAHKSILDSNDSKKIAKYLDAVEMEKAGYKLSNTQVAELTAKLAILKQNESAS